MSFPFHAAVCVARHAHRGKMRCSGEAYITHPLAVVRILRDCMENVPCDIVTAAVLHDVLEEASCIEDFRSQLAMLERVFGHAVASMVLSLTKDPAHYQFPQGIREQRYVQRLRTHARRHPGILLIKLADRIHNLETAAALPRERRHALVRETQELYLPLFADAHMPDALLLRLEAALRCG